MIQPNTNPFELAKSLSGYHLIDGNLVPAVSGKTFSVLNPATMEEMGRAAEGDAQDVDIAVAAAKRAQKEWAKMSARKKATNLAERTRRRPRRHSAA